MAVGARLKRAIKHFLIPIHTRWMAGVHGRIATIESGWNYYLPTFLSAASSIGAFGHELVGLRRDLEQQIASLRGQVEAISHRIEDLAGAENSPASANARILAPDKVSAARLTGLKLNLDCGEGVRPDFINVDRDPLPGVDIMTDPGQLPFGPGSVLEIDSGGLLDRIGQAELQRRLLPFWHSLLVPGGRFRALVRDAGSMVAALAAGKCSFDEFSAGLLEPSPDGYFRGNLFTPESLSRLLAEAGFVNIEAVAAPRQGEAVARFEISAERALT